MDNIGSPLVSIIIPTYNRPLLLERALKSVLNQTYQNFEIIIIDDASTSDYTHIVDFFQDKRIIFKSHTNNKGVLGAYNTGLEIAKGDYISFLGDDDELDLNAFEIIVKRFQEKVTENIKILWFDCIDVECSKNSGTGISKQGYIQYKELLCGKITGDHWIVFNRDMKSNVRFNEKFWGMEGIIWLQLLKINKVYYFPISLYKAHRKDGERISIESPLKNLKRKILGWEEYFRLFGSDLASECPKKYGEILALLGYLHLLDNNFLKGRKYLLDSLKYHMSVKYFILFLLSFIFTQNQLIAILKFLNKI